MNRIDRLLGIVTLLQSRKYVPAEKIMQRYQISLRTVYRDIKALCEQGIPISFEATKGYFVMSGYFLSPVSFTSEEANAFLLMEQMVTAFADKSIHKHYSSALQKIRAVLRSQQKESLELLDNSMRFQVPKRLQNNSEFLSPLQNSITSKTIVILHYKNNNDEISDRKVEPMGLIFYAFNWHLIAFCQLRNDYRDFKVSRILNLTSTHFPFNRKELSLNDYMKLLPVDY